MSAEDNKAKKLIPFIEDEEFERGKVPMTKASVRHLSIGKLGLEKASVLFDVGSGTGSIAVEAALLDESIRVYAIERKEEAIELIERNREKFSCDNIEIVHGEAPDVFETLEPPTHAFIGGSNGRLGMILLALSGMSSNVRVVANAVSLETISEITKIIKDANKNEESIYYENFELHNISIEQVAVTSVRVLGSYHMMSAENPVLIAAFDLQRKEPVRK